MMLEKVQVLFKEVSVLLGSAFESFEEHRDIQSDIESALSILKEGKVSLAPAEYDSEDEEGLDDEFVLSSDDEAHEDDEADEVVDMTAESLEDDVQDTRVDILDDAREKLVEIEHLLKSETENKQLLKKLKNKIASIENGIRGVYAEVERQMSLQAKNSTDLLESPVSGTFYMSNVGIWWKGQPKPKAYPITKSANGTAQCYKDLSMGAYTFLPQRALIVKVPYERSRSNLPKAESLCRIAANNQTDKKYPHKYFIVNYGAKGFSNGSGDTAHMYGTLERDWKHEGMHLRPTVLGHAGTIDSKGVVKGYGDGTSFMSKFPAWGLAFAHIDFLDWNGPREIEDFSVTDVHRTFYIHKLESGERNPYLKSVRMHSSDGKGIFYLSAPKFKNGEYKCAIHTQPKRSTLRHKVFTSSATIDEFTINAKQDAQENYSVEVFRAAPRAKI